MLSVQPSSVSGDGLSFGTTAAAWVAARLAAQSYLGAAYEFQQYDDHTTSKSQVGYISIMSQRRL